MRFVLEMDPLLLMSVFRLRRHDEESKDVTWMEIELVRE